MFRWVELVLEEEVVEDRVVLLRRRFLPVLGSRRE